MLRSGKFIRYQGIVKRLYFRGDAAFANLEIYEFLEAAGIGYTTRLPANTVLQNRIGHLIGRPPHKVCYQAQSSRKSRRVVAKVQWHPNELYSRIGLYRHNLARPAERLVAFNNQRGTAEQWIKEGKSAIKWTRLSCRTLPPTPSVSSPCSRLQSRQLDADRGAARNNRAVVADQPARETDQDRREGRQPRALLTFQLSEVGGVATDVRGYPVVRSLGSGHHPCQHETRGSDLRQARAAQEARLNAGKSARLPPRCTR